MSVFLKLNFVLIKVLKVEFIYKEEKPITKEEEATTSEPIE